MNPIEAFDAGVPAYGTWVLYAFLVAAALSFSLSLAAATERDAHTSLRYLRAARLTALGTCALVALDVLLLLYGFVSHDFRIRYVMRYSDRSMPGVYLVSALWGGQDGSLLWWTFLLSGYTAACVLWLKNRYTRLAPYVIATLMSVVLFFGVMMSFAANPFAANVAGAPPNGEGLNPSLQNFYMAIHPPSLYVGFVGCAVPFAFAVAALFSGRLDDEWIKASRRWALFSWVFLSIGNTLGMLWAYEELGWGGFWAWDPVENAACMPWFTMTAYLHSVMIQERRGGLKVWNVALLILTFALTIFGTFLTRSGLIASIHSFAQSEIGVYFLYFLALVLGLGVALIAWRYPKLRKPTEIDAVLSREAMFVANNWVLLGICVFIVVATVWPKVSEWLWTERLTVGASFYNFWLPIPGCVLLAMMAIGTLTPWRKGSPRLLWEAFRGPLFVGALVSTLHVLFGRALAMPAVVTIEPIYPSAVGRTIAWLDGHLPALAMGLVAMNLAAIVQEFYRGTAARVRSKNESPLLALFLLTLRNSRRYGGYLVHVGFALMFFGWVGSVWRVEAEATVRPGQSFSVGRYNLRFEGTSTRRDPNRRELYARIAVSRDGRPFVNAAPAKFTYTTHPDMPTSEVSITSGLREDLYLVLASANEQTGSAHLKAFVNPLTAWIWIGGIILVLGVVVAMLSQPNLDEAALRTAARGGSGGGGDDPKPQAGAGAGAGEGPAATLTARAMLGLLAAGAVSLVAPREANAQHTNNEPPPVGGVTEQYTPEERRLYDRLLCMCGGCQRLPLATCTCDWAASWRRRMREALHDGRSADAIVNDYVSRYGAAAVAVPPDAGHNRAVYALPIAAAASGGALAFVLVRRWRARALEAHAASAAAGRTASATTPGESAEADARRSAYDKRLDEELRGLDE